MFFLHRWWNVLCITPCHDWLDIARITMTIGPPSNQALSLSFPAFSCWSSMLCYLCILAKTFDTIQVFKSCLNNWRVTIHQYLKNPEGRITANSSALSFSQKISWNLININSKIATKSHQSQNIRQKKKTLRYVRRAMYAKVKESESSASGTPHWSGWSFMVVM